MSKTLAVPTRERYFSTIRENISKPKNWKLFAAFFGGKMIGLLAVIAAMVLVPDIIGTSAHAAETYTAHET
jgi:Amt family ammonium transporter